MCNQKMNSYLKEIADFCGIKKNLTTHVARHTFGTTVTLANNVPLQDVSVMLGHASTRMTQHYGAGHEQQPERGDEQCEGTSGMVNLISASE